MATGAVPAELAAGLIAPAAAPLASDRAPAVREAVFVAAATWMGADAGGGNQEQQQLKEEGPPDAAAVDRCRRLAPILLPLLLLGVSDEAPAIGSLALERLGRVGAVWAAGCSGGSAGDGDARMDSGEHPSGSAAAGAAAAAPASSAEPSEQAVAAAVLGPPYNGRLPPPGARAMGAALLPALAPPLLRGLGEWTVALRASAARCLHALLALAGAAATPPLARLLPALRAAVGDEDAGVAARVAACVRAVGAFVPPQHWLPLAADAVADGRVGDAARANALVCLAALAHAAWRAGQPAPLSLVEPLAVVLSSDATLASAAEHAGARAQLLSAVRASLAWLGPLAGAPGVAAPLYRTLLQLLGSAHAEGAAGEAEAALALDALSQLEAAATAPAGGGSGAAAASLCAAHGAALLEALAATAPSWAPGAPLLLALGALLTTAPPDQLAALLPRAVDVIAPVVGDADGDPALRLALLRLVDALLESDAAAPAFRADGGAAAALVVTRLLMPPLTWRAGKAAAAVRYAAVAALEAAVRRGLAGADALEAALRAGLLPLLHGCLDEDWFPDVRLAAARVEGALLEAVGPSLTDDQRRAVYVELLKRLDDSADRVRVAACGALAAFARSLPRDGNGAGSASAARWDDANAGYLAAGLAVHMDDADAGVADAAAAALEALAGAKPAAVAAEVAKARPRARAKHRCDRVLAACGVTAGCGGGGAHGEDGGGSAGGGA